MARYSAPEEERFPPRPEARPAVPGHEVLEVLGRGGMGVVYRARQVGLNRTVALKVILHGELASSDELHRFGREAEAIARLRHPHIVQIFEVGEWRPTEDSAAFPYFAMELCDGGSLEARLQAAPLSPIEAAGLIRALARAVQHAHDQGIVHRDLKPGNILLASDGTAKIADFGLARRLGEPGQTHSGAVLGTPSYMAPEQAQGKARSADARADVYSLGAILYECVTGRPPFKAATSAETLMQVIADEVVPPRRLQPKVPRDLETVCLKCLHKEPGKRYASAADLADDLDRFLGGLPIRARPGGLAERTIKWVRRRPAVAGLLALVIAVTVGGLALVANAWAGAEWERDRAEERRQEAENQRELAREAQDQAEAEAKNAHRLKLQAERATERALKGERAARDAQLESDRQRRRVDEKATEEKKARQLADQARLQTETALNRTRHALAASRVSQAQHALREGNFGLALDLLDRCAPDARHWDWHHLWRAVHGEVLLHDVENWVALSADGKRLAAVRRGKPNAIAILDFATGKEQLVLKGHAARVRCFAFRPDGREIASADLAGQIKLWDAASGKLTHTLAGHKGAVNGLTWLPDGKGLASAGEDGTRLWDATGKGRLLVGHTGSVLAVAASANGRWLASVSLGVAGVAGPKGRPARPGELIIWDRARGSAAHTLRAGFDAEDLTFHPDGSLVRSSTSLTASPDLRVPASGGSIEIIDPETGKVQRTLRGVSRSGVFRVACSPDGRRLACLAHTGDMPVTLKTFDYRTGKQLTDFPALEHREGPLLFTPDGRFVVHLYQGLRLMDLRGEPDHLVLRGAHRGGAQTLAFAPDGRRLYSGGRDGLVQVWDTVTGLRLETLFAEPAGVAGLAVSPNGKVLATCSESNLGRTGSLRLWDATTGKLLHNLQGFHGGVGCVAFTTDGKGLISGGGTIDKGEINLWEVATGKRVRTISAHKGSVIRVVPSPDGVRLASVAILQPDVKIWNLRTGMELGSLRSLAPAMGLAYHPSGLFLAVASSPSIVDRRGEIKIWDLRFPREFHVLAGHHAQACAVAFSPDGVRLASGALDGGVYTWDTLNGQEVLRLDPGRRVPSTNELDRGTTWAVAFSPGGQVLAAAGGDGRIRLWKGQRGREEVHLRYRTGRSIWFAARTGSWIQAVRDEDGAVRIWDARTGRTILAIQPDATGQSAVSYALDADRLAVRRNGALEVYDTASGKLLQTLPPPPRGEQPWYLTLSADAERLATVNVLFEGPQASGLRIRVRDLRTGKELSNHTGPLEWATGLDLNADLTRLSYSGAKGERLGWDLTAGKAAPPAAGRTVEVVWKAEGRVVHEERFGAGFAKGVRVLDARTTEDDRTFRAALVRFDDTWHSVEAEETAEAEEWAVAAWHLRRLADAIRAGEHEAAVMAWGQYAYAARMTEGEAAYRRTCTELLRRFGETMDPRVANVVAWTCVLAPDAVPNPTVPRRLAELAVARDGKNASWLGTLGLALYRCGEHKAAVGRLEEAVKLEEKRKPPGGLFPTLAVAGAPEDHFVLAMAHARLGNRKVAEDWLRKGQAMADDRVKNPLRVMLGQAASWQRRVEWRWLREEAERTIKGMKP